MMTKENLSGELLKLLGEVHQPDVRNTQISVFGADGWRAKTLEDHHAAIAQFTLNEQVPKDVVIQYETAKNVYLYAWFVYRFYPVAQLQVLSCLEFGLRERLEKSVPKRYMMGKRVTLHGLLSFAVDQGIVRNEGFRRWSNIAKERAMERYRWERIQEMKDQGLDEIEIDYSQASITAEDRNLDYVDVLKDVLPKLRNHHAHGSSSLNPSVLIDFEITADILNQIYS